MVAPKGDVASSTVKPQGFPSALRGIIDAAAALSLVLAVVLVVVLDRGSASAPPEFVELPPPPEDLPPPPTRLDPASFLPPIDPIPRVAVAYTADGRFGLMTTTGDPEDPTDDNKRMTYAADGHTNNTRVWVDGDTPLFGKNLGKGKMIRPIAERDGRFTCAWTYGDIEVEQVVELVGGEISRRTDTIRVTYTMKNNGAVSHQVGLRVMLDTLIGGNDGVPFTVPEEAGLISSSRTFTGDSVPPFIRALEFFSTERPGVVVNIGGLRPSTGEAVDEAVLSHWPGGAAEWNYA